MEGVGSWTNMSPAASSSRPSGNPAGTQSLDQLGAAIQLSLAEWGVFLGVRLTR
jgi:hypothetical protein